MSIPHGGDRRGLADLTVVLVASLAVLLSGTGVVSLPWQVRVPLGYVGVFVLPGYAVTMALYPAASVPWRPGPDRPLTPVETVVLSVGLSIAVVPLSVLLLTFALVPIGPATSLATVSGVTLVATVGAAIGRLAGPTRGSTAAPVWRTHEGGSAVRNLPVTTLFGAGLLVVGVSLAGVAVLDNDQGERYTELSVLTADGSGNLTASGGPTTLTVGEPEPLVVAVGNHEGRETTYRVAVRLGPPGGDQRTLDRFTVTVADGTVERVPRSITAEGSPGAGQHRLAVVLTRGADTDPTSGAPYRRVHVWTNVSGGS